MCGVAGIYAYGSAANSVDQAELIRIRDHMAARGPDGFGIWASDDRRVAFGHRRLSIIDLSERGAQPMATADGKLIVTFNGEIYNYRALRAELEGQGYVFRTESDTEVLLHLYAAKGAGMVDRLRGMFAFAIWDSEKRGLLLARDGFGIKPLWYSEGSGQFRFASQVRALLAGDVSREADPAGWVGFYLFGSVPEPYSTYSAIRSLPAGTTLWVDAAGVKAPTQYFSVADVYRQAEDQRHPSSAVDLEMVHTALLDSVRRHLVSDVPVGLFLSAGIDSGALLGLMREAGQSRTVAVTLTYDEYRGKDEDEAPLAIRLAAHYGSEHHVRRVSEQEFRDDLPRIFDAMDQPTVDGINTWFISKAARELSLKAAISGLGGDELFGGYPSFKDIPRWVKWLTVPSRIPGLATAFGALIANFNSALAVSPKLTGLLRYGGTYPGAYLLRRGLFLPSELELLMDKEFAVEGLKRLRPLETIARTLTANLTTSFGKVATLETSLYMRNQLLRDTDWASMAHSLEVRVPFVDPFLLRELAPMTVRSPFGTGKRWLGESPRTPLPSELIERPKTGFGIPVADWLLHHPDLQTWRHIPKLARIGCPWARRWAYELAAA